MFNLFDVATEEAQSTVETNYHNGQEGLNIMPFFFLIHLNLSSEQERVGWCHLNAVRHMVMFGMG